MRPGEQFELRCYEHLKTLYKDRKTVFWHEGGMDSTKSDIAAVKNGKIDFYIEAKDASAQSGQFVLLPDEEKKVFVFSPRNHSEPNEMTDIIIHYMNQDFQRFNHAGTAGESLNIDTGVFADWIVEHYKDKNVKYVISCGKDFVIFPIRKFREYFKITANYRIKKSGSGRPAGKDIPAENKPFKHITLRQSLRKRTRSCLLPLREAFRRSALCWATTHIISPSRIPATTKCADYPTRTI